ncbi:uncharacterized protein DUF955 [Cytobacillus firmus]|uniref:Uncharacterized protein DUF955 n=2 Tax=Cytobacillus TaxID=2675230 RepID=A0A366JNE8_CYTFI|nr:MULTISPECIES: ImmA/IrrE family metallo-endopeptidase [Cytobacillus]RBP87870.1 uncharacterized protein DUF955 [Cytobacillus firmus]TDX39233.1 uncharacterized protein DUF955 [Cytobacillus oceanisediminis]
MKYQTTLLEDWIKNFYYRIGIFRPQQLDMLEIIYRLGMSVKYMDISSRFYQNVVIIDERLSPQEQWEEFGHELCHYQRHEGNQLILSVSFLKLQESQAALFSYHFCVPTFMLLKIKFPPFRGQAVELISDTFNVTLEFANNRLAMFENRINSTLFFERLYQTI